MRVSGSEEVCPGCAHAKERYERHGSVTTVPGSPASRSATSWSSAGISTGVTVGQVSVVASGRTSTGAMTSTSAASGATSLPAARRTTRAAQAPAHADTSTTLGAISFWVSRSRPAPGTDSTASLQARRRRCDEGQQRQHPGQRRPAAMSPAPRSVEAPTSPHQGSTTPTAATRASHVVRGRLRARVPDAAETEEGHRTPPSRLGVRREGGHAGRVGQPTRWRGDRRDDPRQLEQQSPAQQHDRHDACGSSPQQRFRPGPAAHRSASARRAPPRRSSYQRLEHGPHAGICTAAMTSQGNAA